MKLMGVAAVAEYLDVPESWVYAQWRDLGIPFRKVGQKLRCRPADLEKWFQRQEGVTISLGEAGAGTHGCCPEVPVSHCSFAYQLVLLKQHQLIALYGV